MVQSSSIGSSVEGEKLRLQTRKWSAVPPIRCPVTQKKQYRFRLGMRGEAVIREAYENPNEHVYLTTSFTAVGDFIEGAAVSGWTRKPPGPPHITTCSGTHSGTVVQVSGGCFAEIEQAPREHLNSADIQARNPAIAQIRRIPN